MKLEDKVRLLNHSYIASLILLFIGVPLHLSYPSAACAAMGAGMGSSLIYCSRRNATYIKKAFPKYDEKKVFQTSALISSVSSASFFVIASPAIGPIAFAGLAGSVVYSGVMYYHESNIFDNQDVRFKYF